VSPTAVLQAKPILDRLVQSGVPNYLGSQRFGYRQNSHTLGRLLLQRDAQGFLDELLGKPSPHESEHIQRARGLYDQGDIEAALEAWPRSLRFDRQALDALRQGKDAAGAVNAIQKNQRQFLVSAWQSAVFNAVVDRRIRDGLFDQLVVGDLAFKHDSRAVFAVGPGEAEQDNAPGGRVEQLEVSPSGPMWGGDMTLPGDAVLDAEREALAASGIDEVMLRSLSEADDRDATKPEGSRRAMRFKITDPQIAGGVDEHGPYLKVVFELPRGAYATVVLRELMKNDVPEKPGYKPVEQAASNEAAS